MRGRRSRKAALIGLMASLLWVPLDAVHPATSAAVGVSNLTAKTNTPTSTLTLRSCASTTCSALRQVPHGTLLAVTAASGDWFQTSYGGTSGWVHSRYTVLQGTPATTISRGNTSRRMVSYTFDAGADLGYTGTILDFLRSNNIKASFGMTGKWAAANPTYVQRMANEGHHIFNHTWSHGSFTGFSTGTAAMTPARRTEELVRTNNKIIALTGKSTRPYFRPPYGDYNSGVLRDIGANRFSRNVMWSVDSLGWKGLTAAQICDRVVSSMSAASNGGNGYIILFHVGAQSQDANALPCITNTLKGRGFTFGTVSQVIAP
jgi:peptidoglycan/xylan/chitin deacetylase (PgdA/CDA1 family)